MEYAIKVLFRVLVTAFLLGLVVSCVPGLLGAYIDYKVKWKLKQEEKKRHHRASQDSIINHQKRELKQLQEQIIWFEDTHRSDEELKKRQDQKIGELRIYLEKYQQKLADSVRQLDFLRERMSILRKQARETAQSFKQSERRNYKLEQRVADLNKRFTQQRYRADSFYRKAAQHDDLMHQLHLLKMGYPVIILLLGLLVLYARRQNWRIITRPETEVVTIEKRAMHKVDEDAIAS